MPKAENVNSLRRMQTGGLKKKKKCCKNKTCIDAADFTLSAKYENQQVVVRNRATSEVTEQFCFLFVVRFTEE